MNLSDLVATHGYWIVAVIIALESSGVPIPGETALVSAAIFAGKTHRLNIWLIIAAAAIGAIAGGSLGYGIGRTLGHRVLIKYGAKLHLDAHRIKLGQYLFKRHGGKVVFFGRFVAVLRALAAVLAGVNCMDWRRFALINASGGIIWAMAFGLGAYSLGAELDRLRRPAAIVLSLLAVVGVVAGVWFIRMHEGALQAEAERELPGPIR